MADKHARSTSRGGAVLALKPQVISSPQPSAQAPDRWQDQVAIVGVRGDLDREAIDAIDFTISRASAEAGRIVLDLTEVGHLDYAGVGVLVSRRRGLQERGGDLLVAVRSPYVANILRAAGGGDLLLCRSVAEASGQVTVAKAGIARSARKGF